MLMRAGLAILLGMAACGKAPPEEGFELQARPKPGEWLHEFPEAEQSVADYQAGRPNRKTSERFLFYIQPLGAAAERHPVLLERMRAYAEAFFGLEARLLPAIPLDEATYVPTRRQYNSTRLIERLAERAPADALVYAGFTTEDLFSPGLNYVFGEGSPRKRAGIYSLHRYGTPDPALFLRRVLKLLSHEAGHILSIHHCVRYRCVMQGANSLAEHDAHPAHLCPDDLQKLRWATGVDPRVRYGRLLDFYEMAGLEEEAAWTRGRAR